MTSQSLSDILDRAEELSRRASQLPTAEGAFKSGDIVRVTRDVPLSECFSTLPKPLVDLAIAANGGDEYAYHVGDVGIITVKHPTRLVYTLGVEHRREATAPENAIEKYVAKADGYPEGFVPGATVYALRDIDLEEIYKGKVEASRIRKVTLMMRGMGIEHTYSKGDAAEIGSILDFYQPEDHLIIARNANNLSGHPVKAEWFSLTKPE